MIEKRGVFDAGAVARLMARATDPTPDARAGRLMWALLVFEFWARSFLDRAPNPPADRPRLAGHEIALAGPGS